MIDDTTSLRKYLYEIEDEDEINLLYSIFDDALNIIKIREKLKSLEENLFAGDRGQHLFTVSPFENDEAALTLGVMVLKGKIDILNKDKKSEEEEPNEE